MRSLFQRGAHYGAAPADAGADDNARSCRTNAHLRGFLTKYHDAYNAHVGCKLL